MPTDVTFMTSCYEGDWEELLLTNRLVHQMAACRYPFAHRRLLLNHLGERGEVLKALRPLVALGIIDDYLFTADLAPALLKRFAIAPEGLDPGYHYLIQNLTAVASCPTAYLLWMTCDSQMANAIPWIDAARIQLASVPWLVAANPVWNFDYAGAALEAQAEVGAFYLSFGFTDQCHLIAVTPYRQAIYGSEHPVSTARYPLHAGNSFERRVDAWMRHNGLMRLVHREAVYVHENFPKKRKKAEGGKT